MHDPIIAMTYNADYAIKPRQQVCIVSTQLLSQTQNVT